MFHVFVGTKYFDFQRAALFCLGQHLSKYKTTKKS